MWPFSPPAIEARPLLHTDPSMAIVYLTFRDPDGIHIDGSIGIDALAKGFAHRGRRVRLSGGLTAMLARIAEHGGRWQPGQGFAFREEDVPDLLRAIRTLPNSSAEETPEVRRLIVDARALAPTDSAELIGDDLMERSTSFRDADGQVAIPVKVVQAGSKRSWVRSGSGFYRRPKLTAAEVDNLAADQSDVLTGDAIPYFLAKQLHDARKAGRAVLLGPRAQAARVLENEWLPDVKVDLRDERLQFDVSFKTGEFRIPLSTAKGARKSRYIRLPGDVWARNDQDARERVERVLKELPEVRQSSKTGSYSTPASALPALQESFAAIGTLDLSEAAKALRDRLLDFTRIENIPIPRRLKATLRDYQRHGLNWLGFLRRYGLSGVLADDMGLGKTVQTLSAILAAHEAGQYDASLVVCPASVTSVWAREVQRWCDGVKPVVLTADNRAKYLKSFPRETIAVVSYAAVARDPDLYNKRVWNYLVLDEAHRVKNHETVTARACKGLVAKHKVAVTGTPIQNRLKDLWSLYDSIMPGHLGTSAAFERNFGNPIEKEKDEKVAEQLRRRIDPFKLRRLKSQVAKDLPPLNQQVRTVRLLRQQQDMYDDLVKEIVPKSIDLLRDPSRRGGQLQVLEKLLRLRQVCAHPRLVDPTIPLYGSSAKFEEYRELLEDSVESGHRVLVFSQWKQMCDLICEHLTGNRIAHGVLDGSVPTAERARLVERFQKPNGPQVLVVSLLAGGEGITLTEADTVVMYDRWWNPAVEDQAVARAHRIGQTRPVTAYILETKNTVEQRLAELLGTKKELAEDLIAVDAAEKRITREDLLAVLQDELKHAGRRGAEDDE